MVKLVILICKGLIRSQQSRRQLMFYLALGAMALLLAGSTVLQENLRAAPVLFVGYWLVVAWLTVTFALMAVFDLLMVRREARAERRRLEREYLATKPEEGGDL